MTLRAGLSALAACWLGACSFPNYGFEPETEPLASICADGLPSAAESDIDCGGGCMPCDLGRSCLEPKDCVSIACDEGLCVPPSCNDDVKNGAESDVDCGGECEPCPFGRDCRDNADCESRVCSEGFCRAPECDDDVQNGVETSTDCGGSCDPCAHGSACGEDGDCESNRCEEMICVSAGCTNDAIDGEETDVDCGGTECGPCQASEDCLEGSDCESLICDENAHCTAPACNDDVLNGTESDQDCGGGECDGCDILQACGESGDCASDTCQSGLCVPASATGDALARDGWSASASNTHPNDTPDDALTPAGVDGDFWSSGEDQVTGMYFEMDMAELRAFFSIQMECMTTADMAGLFDVYLSKDGDFSDEQPAREDVTGFALTTIEFATAQVARYIRIELSAGKPNWWCIDDFRVYE
jgi:hypothetical protein